MDEASMLSIHNQFNGNQINIIRGQMKKVCLLFMVAGMLTNVSFAQDKSQFPILLAKAKEEYAKKNYIAARNKIEEAEKVIDKAGSGEITDFLKTALKITSAGEDYSALVKQGREFLTKYAAADDESLLISLSEEMIREKRNDLARKLLKANVDLFPTSIICFRKFGEIFTKTGKLAEALAYYRELAEAAEKKNVFLAVLSKLFYSRLDECSPYANEKMKDVVLNIAYRFKISYQDQSYFIDPEQKILNSEQVYTIKNAGKEATRKIYFAIHPQFIIESITVQDPAGKSYGPTKVKFYSFDEALGSFLAVFTAETNKDIQPNQNLKFKINYRLRPEFVLPEPQIWGFLTVSPKATYSVYPNGGMRLMFGLNEASPFRMKIKYPQGNLTCAPGKLISSEKEGKYIIETYESKTQNIPAFSCAPYNKVERKNNDVAVEFYLYGHLKFQPEIADHVLKAIELFFKYFGDNGTDCYRIAASGVYDASPIHRGGENKGNAIYLSDDRLKNMLGKKEEISVLFHEIFHDYNLFYLSWEGNYNDWFSEGGANFIQAWVSEKLLGGETGKNVRKNFLESFIKDQGYKATVALDRANKSVPYGRTLIYNYGALVWEQLRLKLGEAAFLAGYGDLFKKDGLKTVTFNDFGKCWEPYTTTNVGDYLRQWLDHNARVALSIAKVETSTVDGKFVSEVTISTESDRDYEIFTSIGYKTGEEEKMNLLPVHLLKKGIEKITFTSDREPLFIQVDPEYRVPQMRLENLTWEKGKR